MLTRPKIILDPVCGAIDVSRVLPMIEASEFQALAGRRQLGLTSLVFPSATHTRLAHSLGAFQATRVLCDRLTMERVLNEETAWALCAFALYHDIGHGPFSHVTEHFSPLDHKQRTAQIIEFLAPTIRKCGINSDLVQKFAGHNDPLAKLVYDKNFGTEKLDYLKRDGSQTICSQPAGINYLQQYIYWVDGCLAIDEKVVEQAEDLMTFYIKMFKEVYFRKALLIAQRMFHKMVFFMVGDEISRSTLQAMTDSELLGQAAVSEQRAVKHLYKRLRERRLFKEAIVIRPERFIRETRVADKSIKTFGVREEEARRLSLSPSLQNNRPIDLSRMEDAIGELAGIPGKHVLIVPVFNPERFNVQDVTVFSNWGLESLKERRPAFFAGLEETAQSYLAIRVCTTPELRARLSNKLVAPAVLDLILSTCPAA